MKNHILIVEDDPHIRLGLVDALTGEGYKVSEISHGNEVMPFLKQTQPGLVILDVMLPGKSGFNLCREIRASKHAFPILMLTAKGQEVDKVVGLELGADDYVTKPFGIRELLARIHALLRRFESPSDNNSPKIPKEIRFGQVSIQSASLRGTCGKSKIELSPRELKVLALLHSRSGEVVSRDEILNKVWGLEYYGSTRTLDQVIVKIRQKVETDPANPRHLKTVHGVGYRLDIDLAGRQK